MNKTESSLIGNEKPKNEDKNIAALNSEAVLTPRSLDVHNENASILRQKQEHSTNNEEVTKGRLSEGLHRPALPLVHDENDGHIEEGDNAAQKALPTIGTSKAPSRYIELHGKACKENQAKTTSENAVPAARTSLATNVVFSRTRQTSSNKKAEDILAANAKRLEENVNVSLAITTRKGLT